MKNGARRRKSIWTHLRLSKRFSWHAIIFLSVNQMTAFPKFPTFVGRVTEQVNTRLK